MEKIIAKLESFSPSESQVMGEPFSTDKAIEVGKKLILQHEHLFDSADVFPEYDGGLTIKFYTKYIDAEVTITAEGEIASVISELPELAEKDINSFLIYVSDFPGRFKCSFCGENLAEVKYLVAGENAFICDKCIPGAKEFVESKMGAGAVGAHLPQEDEQVRALRSRSKEDQ